MRDVNHHTGNSPLQALSVGMVSQFPLDYMHLVGVVSGESSEYLASGASHSRFERCKAASGARAASDAGVALRDHQSSRASLGGGFHEATCAIWVRKP